MDRAEPHASPCSRSHGALVQASWQGSHGPTKVGKVREPAPGHCNYCGGPGRPAILREDSHGPCGVSVKLRAATLPSRQLCACALASGAYAGVHRIVAWGGVPSNRRRKPPNLAMGLRSTIRQRVGPDWGRLCHLVARWPFCWEGLLELGPHRTVELVKCSPSGKDVKVAVVVPTRNSGRTLEACLRSLRDQTVRCVIVVVDNHSRDDTTTIACQYADIVAVAGPERSAQRNDGAALTTSPILGFIDSDMVVDSTVVEQAASALLSGAGGIVIPEHSFGEGFWADVRRFERSFYHGSDSVEAARFFRRDVFEGVGGFDEAMEPGPEDWDLTIRVRNVAAVARISANIAHDEGRPTFWDACAKKGYYAPGLRSFVRKHGPAAVSVLDRPYVRRPWRIFAQGPRLGLGLVALKTGEATAVVAATIRRSRR